MDTLHVLFTYLLYILFFSITIYTVKFYTELIRKKQSKNELANLQAKISVLKMALRTRVKAKIRNFRFRFLKEESEGDAIEASLMSLSENSFETSKDFEYYIELSQKINGLIDTELRASSKYTEAQKAMKFEEFMGADFKNEIAIIRILKEISDTNELLIRKIDQYNQLLSEDKEKKIVQVKSLIFPSLSKVNQVLQNSEIALKYSQSLKEEDLYELVS